jgi:hypothetical protein
VAYDNVHDRYLAVQGHGFIEGVLTDAGGGVLVPQFPINASRAAWSGEYAQTPRVAFGPDVNGGAGGYLVTWHESLPGNFAQVRGRLVSADGVPLGSDIVISLEAVNAFSSTNWTMGAAVAYSTLSHEFLVAWMGSYTISNDIRCNRVSASGAVLQALVTPVTTASPDWERDPSVVYNPDTDEFFIAYAGFHNALLYAYTAGQRVKAGTGQLLGGPIEYDQVGGSRPATYIPSVTYNSYTKQYLAVWYHATSVFSAFYGIRINADGTPASGLIVESSRYVAYDALDVKYNKVSGDYALVTHSNTTEDAAVSIKADGTPYDNGFLATSTAATGSKGNFNPRLAATDKSPKWLMVTAANFTYIGGQFLLSSAAAPGPVSHPMLSIDTPVGGVVQQPFIFAGWAADLGSSSGPGADVVHTWAWPAGGGNPTFVSAAAVGWSRPDVGAIFGSQFTPSGYGLIVNGLRGGTYQIAGYVHSTVSGTFPLGRAVTVTISEPMMSIDIPFNGQTVSSKGFNIAGWSFDRGAAAGTGVNTLHVWAFPLDTAGSPIFCGVAGYGFARADVGAIFGSQFANSGFGLTVTNLPPGHYTIVVFSNSAVTGTFNASHALNVTVQ